MTVEPDRIRRHTAAAVLQRIDGSTETTLNRLALAGDDAIDARLVLLDHEWDCDRVIEAEAATTGLLGVALGAFAGARWLALPALVASGLLLYSISGRYPMLPLLRRRGVRSAREIERERYALKSIRGDFAALAGDPERSSRAPMH